MKQWLDDNTLPVIVILGMIVTMFAALTYGYEIENCHAKNTYSQVPESIFGCPISEDIERITAQENQWAYDDQQRQEIKIADHKAQVEMAYYAKVGLILALFGSWLLYWTLSYTRDAAQAAAKTLGIAHDTLTHSKEVSLTEQRPWIFIERDVACEFNFSERGVQLYWRYVVQNIGKTPAYHFVRKQTIVRSDTIVINEKHIDDVAIELTRKISDGLGSIIIPNQPNMEHGTTSQHYSIFDAIPGSGESYHIIAGVAYTDKLRTDIFYDIQVYKISRRVPFGPLGSDLIHNPDQRRVN